MGGVLGNAGSPQLLILIGLTLAFAIFFAAVIAVSLSRRSRKSRMKPGSQASSTERSSPPRIEAEVDSSLLATFSSGPDPAPQPESPAGEPDLSLAILSRSKVGGPSPPDKSEPSPETENLSDRLNNFSAADRASISEPGQPPSDPTELLRLLRHPETGQLIVEVAGQRYTKLAEVTDKKVGQYILRLATHFLAFTNGVIGTESGVKAVFNPKVGKTPPPLTPVAPSPEREAPPAAPAETGRAGSVPKPPPEVEAAFLESLRSQPSPPASPPRPGLLGRSTPPPPASSASSSSLPGLNLAEEINKIAQSRLMASPLASSTDLEITSDPGGGIRIKVNGVIYTSPNDVPQAEVRELIKASIKQWERS
jgi:hypothetical protein